MEPGLGTQGTEEELSLGRVVQKSFLEEVAFELGLDELGIGHEAERKAELGLKKMAHSDGDDRAWEMSVGWELGTRRVARGSEVRLNGPL